MLVYLFIYVSLPPNFKHPQFQTPPISNTLNFRHPNFKPPISDTPISDTPISDTPISGTQSFSIPGAPLAPRRPPTPRRPRNYLILSHRTVKISHLIHIYA